MKFLLLKISVIVFSAFLLFTGSAEAKTARSSAVLVTANHYRADNRAQILRDFLAQYNSPLAPHANSFIEEADKNGLDWKLVAAIAGNESYFGHLIPPYSNNAWGYGVYGNNVIRFETWDHGIATVSSAIRENYLNKWGATNIHEIGAIYAADPAWASKVSHFINLIEEYESKAANPVISISI
jgi:hypothetical protein